MARIVIPYTYTKYEFSEEATKYSKKLGRRKTSVVGICILTVLAACVFVGNIGDTITDLLSFLPDVTVTLFILLLPLIIGIVIGIKIDQCINSYYLKKRNAALRRDLALFAGDRAEEIFRELTKNDDEIRKIRKRKNK